MRPTEVAAFDALAKHPRLGDLVTLTRTLATAAAKARKAEWTDADKLRAAAEEAKLTADDAGTDFGNALTLLERGPEDDAQRALACALWAHAVAESPPKGREAEDSTAADILWLATHTPFDATRLLDRALGDAAEDLWNAVADRIRGVDEGKLPSLGRGEALLGCAALAMSESPRAQKNATSLATQLKDPALARVLTGRPRTMEDERIAGEMAAPPRSAALTAVLGLTGILLVLNAARLLARLALAYKRPAEVILSDATVRIKSRTELLGRTLRDREIVLPRAELVRAMREVRYPRVGMYAGLLALALGSYVGVGAFVDGVRSASPSLLLAGLLVVAVGVGLDFAFGSLIPGAIGRCRVVFVPARGPSVCVGGVDLRRADEALAKLRQPA